ncbi:hypothetical protein [Spirosoma endbachense]|uniref:Uncharacterized protein n=1 Tax=Spirosoma endbachense TaxID=2666025 RepID=A0A6P1W0Y0_9BACT|nr:hypothetical protein [Spirosoma endbachense]QHV98248.1 hypothetical protein GJR95_26035 [Spirosoma endbachense]
MPISQPLDIEQARNLLLFLSVDGVVGVTYPEQVYYAQFTKALKDIRAATLNLEQSAEIIVAVINQGCKLAKSTEWINRELLFEAQAVCLNMRNELMLSAVRHAHGSDIALDLYNERLSRYDY